MMSWVALRFFAGLACALYRASSDVDQGITDLRAAAAVAPEWKRVSYGQSGQWGVSAERATLDGMLRHIETSRSAFPIDIIHTGPRRRETDITLTEGEAWPERKA